MPQSWIRSLPTTEAKSVSLVPAASLHACIVQLLIGWVTIWAVLASGFSLTVSLSLIGCFFTCLCENSVLAKSITTPFRYLDSGRIEWLNGLKYQQVERFLTLHANWFLIIIFCDGERQILWRDSCTESAYRRLIVLEKRRRYYFHSS